MPRSMGSQADPQESQEQTQREMLIIPAWQFAVLAGAISAIAFASAVNMFMIFWFKGFLQELINSGHLIVIK